MILELDAQRSNLFSHLYQSIWWRASVYAVRVHFRSTDWRLSDTRPNTSREYCGDVNISVIDTFRPDRGIVFRELGKSRASRFRISVYRSSISMRETHRAYVRLYMCVHLRHVGSLFVPRAERPAVSVSLVLFVFLRPSPTRRDLITTTTIPLPRLHASIASMRVSIDALRARRE